MTHLTLAKRISILLAPLSLLAAPLSFAGNVTWNPASGNFLTGTNWSTGNFPGTNDTALINTNRTATLSTASSSTISQLFLGQGSAGTMIQSNGALTITSGLVVGRSANGNGTYTMTGGTINTVNFRVGGATTGATGTMTVSNSGTTVTTTGASTDVVGVGEPGSGTLTLQNSATWNHTGDAFFAVGGDNSPNTPNPDQSGSTSSSLNVTTGATLTISSASSALLIGRSNGTGGIGVVTVDGGTISVAAPINLGVTNASTVSANGQAGTGTLTVTSGSVSATALTMNEGSSTVNLNGGILTIGGVTKASNFGTGIINFDSGVVKAAAANSNFFKNTGTGTLTLNVKSGGLNFNTNGFDVTIAQSLTGGGGLTKQGAGILTLSNAPTYSGNTTITAGTLTINTTSVFADSSDVYIAAGAVLDLAAIGTDTIHGLNLDGAWQGAGTYGAPDSGATFTSSYFLGDGILDVTAVPEPSQYALGMAAVLTVVVLRRRASAHPKATPPSQW